MFIKYTSYALFVILTTCFQHQVRSQSLCSIDNIQIGTPSPCNPATNTYSQEITVYFQNGPVDSLITINEHTFPLDAYQTGFFRARLTALPAHGKKVPAHVFFSSQPACSLIISSAFTAPASCNPSLFQPTLQDFISIDDNQNDTLDAGDWLSYLTRIGNYQGDTARSLSFYLSQLDPNLTIDLNSVQIAPIALPDTIGLNQIDGYDLLQNDIDPDGLSSALIIVAVDSFSAKGGAINLSPNCGGIQYTPPSGSFSTDQFEYVIMDPDGMISSATVVLQTDLDIPLSQVIYVNNDPPATVTGTLGSKTNPYTTLGDAQSNLTADLIYVFKGNAPYDMGIELRDGQYLIGEGAGLKCGGCALEEPAGTAPVFTNTSTTTNDGHAVVLARNNTVQGIKIENTKGYAFANASSAASVGELYIDIESVTGEGGILQLVSCDNDATINIQDASSSDSSAIVFDDVSGDLYYAGSITTTNPGRLMVINACAGSFTFKQNCNDFISQADPAGEGILIVDMTGNLTFEVPVHIGTALTPNGGNHGITLFQDNPGTFSFDSVKIYTKKHTGIWAEDTGDQGTIIIKKGSIIADSAAAILIGKLDVDITLAYVEATDSPTDGVSIREGTGNFFCQVLKGTRIGRVCKPVTVTLDNRGSGTLAPSALYNGVYQDATQYMFDASQTTFSTPVPATVGPDTVTVILTVMTEKIDTFGVVYKRDTFSCSAIVTVEPYSPSLPPLARGTGGANVAGPAANASPASYTGSGGCTFDMSSTGTGINTGAKMQPLANGPAGITATSSSSSTSIYIGALISNGAVGAAVVVAFDDDMGFEEETSIRIDEIDITCGDNCRGAGVVGTNVDEVYLGEGDIDTYKNDGVKIYPNVNSGSRVEIDKTDIHTTESYGLICIGKESTTDEPVGLNPVANTSRAVHENSIILRKGIIDVVGRSGEKDTAVYLENYYLDVILDEVNAKDADIGLTLINTTGTFTVLDGEISGCETVFYFDNAEYVSLNNMKFSQNYGTMRSQGKTYFWLSNCEFIDNRRDYNQFFIRDATLSIYECDFRDNVAHLWFYTNGHVESYIGHSSFEYTAGAQANNPNLHLQTISGNGSLVLSNNSFKGYKNRGLEGASVWLRCYEPFDVILSKNTFQDNYSDLSLVAGGNGNNNTNGASSFYVLNTKSIGPLHNDASFTSPHHAIKIGDGDYRQPGWKRGIISGISNINLGQNAATAPPTYGISYNSEIPNSNCRLSIYGNTLVNGGKTNTNAIRIGIDDFRPATWDPGYWSHNSPKYLSIKNNVGFYSVIRKHESDLCADITGNTFDPIVPGGTRLKLENTSITGKVFSLEKGPNSTLLSTADTILAAENPPGISTDYAITGPITPVSDGTCSSGSGFNDTLVVVTDGYLQEVLLTADPLSKVAKIKLEVTLLKGDGQPIKDAEVTLTQKNPTPASDPALLSTFISPPLTDAKGITSTEVTVGNQTGWLEFEFEYGGSTASAWIYVKKR